MAAARSPACSLPHVAPGNTQVGIEEYLALRAALAVAEERARAEGERAVAAERREQAALEERRQAEAARAFAEDRAVKADQGRAEALAAVVEAQTKQTERIAEAVRQERESANTARGDTKTGLADENRHLAQSLENAHKINQELLARLSGALDLLEAERVAHAKLRASRPDVAIAADVATKELEAKRLEAEVKRLEITTNKEVADQVLHGIFGGLMPPAQAALNGFLLERFPTLKGIPQALPANTTSGALDAWLDEVIAALRALSPLSRLQAALALRESGYLAGLASPSAHPLLKRIATEIGRDRLSRVATLTEQVWNEQKQREAVANTNGAAQPGAPAASSAPAVAPPAASA
jgi:rubrerythrin